jgi:hypothetical protein
MADFSDSNVSTCRLALMDTQQTDTQAQEMLKSQALTDAPPK